MIFDIVLRSRVNGEGGYRAEATGGTRSVASSRAEARTSGNRVGNERQTEEPENPERTPASPP